MTDFDKVKELCDYLVKAWKPSSLRWGWGEALFTYALSELDTYIGEDRYLPFVKAYCDFHASSVPTVDCSDTAAPALTTYFLYKKTGERKYLELTNLTLDYIKNSEKVLEDIPNHFGFSKDAKYPVSIWVDSLMMFSVFTARFGAEQRDEGLLDYAGRQPAVFAKYLMDESDGAWYHAYWVKQRTHYPRRKLFWGRGNGWVVASFPMIYEYLGESSAYAAEIKELYKKSVDGILKYQRQDGAFHTVINKKSTYRELSAAALVACGLYQAVRLGMLNEKYLENADRAFNVCIESLIFDDNGVFFPEISRPTVPMRYIPYLWYKFLPKGRNWNYGVAALALAAIQQDKIKKSARSNDAHN
ncbi:MAG: glycoside hydrolase family 88 protein [Clostridia bacterium]|nr:glycoside hydrolase family 88 protein [Clostridia bacterium]